MPDEGGLCVLVLFPKIVAGAKIIDFHLFVGSVDMFGLVVAVVTVLIMQRSLLPPGVLTNRIVGSHLESPLEQILGPLTISNKHDSCVEWRSSPRVSRHNHVVLWLHVDILQYLSDIPVEISNKAITVQPKKPLDALAFAQQLIQIRSF